MSKISIISTIGKAGAGKGTQARLLQEETDFVFVGTGALLRKRAQRRDTVGKVVKYTLEQGELIPTPIVFSTWMPILEKVKNEGNVKGIIFDGAPRKVYEAQMLDEVFEMFNWKGRFRICHIKISDKEARKRLLLRKRHDDNPSAIKERLAYFKEEVEPMLRYYKKNNMLIEINGEQSVEAVHKEIMRKLKSFLK